MRVFFSERNLRRFADSRSGSHRPDSQELRSGILQLCLLRSVIVVAAGIPGIHRLASVVLHVIVQNFPSTKRWVQKRLPGLKRGRPRPKAQADSSLQKEKQDMSLVSAGLWHRSNETSVYIGNWKTKWLCAFHKHCCPRLTYFPEMSVLTSVWKEAIDPNTFKHILNRFQFWAKSFFQSDNLLHICFDLFRTESRYMYGCCLPRIGQGPFNDLEGWRQPCMGWHIFNKRKSDVFCRCAPYQSWKTQKTLVYL